LAMLLGGGFLRPIGLSQAGGLMTEPANLGYIIIIVIYSSAAYALGWAIRALAIRWFSRPDGDL
jgi:hypothetical protein